MPIFVIGLAAAGAAAATTYLVPLIITVGSSVVLIITSFFAGRKYAQKQDGQEAQEIFELRKEQYERDKQTRAEAETVVVETERDVKGILMQSKKQQSMFGRLLQGFRKSVDNTEESTRALHQTTLSVQKVMDDTSITMAGWSDEMARLQAEIQWVNQALKTAQMGLLEKEQSLDETLSKLSAIENKMTFDLQVQMDKINELQLELTKVYDLLAQNSTGMSLKDAEIETLKTQNARLGSLIQTFEETVVHVTSRLERSVEDNQSQFCEVSALLEENKRLVGLIDELHQKIPDSEPNPCAERPRVENVFRMFR